MQNSLANLKDRTRDFFFCCWKLTTIRILVICPTHYATLTLSITQLLMLIHLLFPKPQIYETPLVSSHLWRYWKNLMRWDIENKTMFTQTLHVQFDMQHMLVNNHVCSMKLNNLCLRFLCISWEFVCFLQMCCYTLEKWENIGDRHLPKINVTSHLYSLAWTHGIYGI